MPTISARNAEWVLNAVKEIEPFNEFEVEQSDGTFDVAVFQKFPDAKRRLRFSIQNNQLGNSENSDESVKRKIRRRLGGQ